MESYLTTSLTTLKAYRKSRLDLAQWVLDNPGAFPELLALCFNDSSSISYKATWILEFVCAERLALLHPHLDEFFTKLPLTKKDQALRPLAKICQMLAISYYKDKDEALINTITPMHKQQWVNCMFDWFITDQKVACKVYGMTSLVYLGTEFKWIHPELKSIILQNIHEEQPAYKARGKSVLKQIEKFEKKGL